MRRCNLCLTAIIVFLGIAMNALAKAWDAVGVYENGVMPTGIR